MKCKSCPGKNNSCYIIGYVIKCGHDNGYAYIPKEKIMLHVIHVEKI